MLMIVLLWAGIALAAAVAGIVAFGLFKRFYYYVKDGVLVDHVKTIGSASWTAIKAPFRALRVVVMDAKDHAVSLAGATCRGIKTAAGWTAYPFVKGWEGCCWLGNKAWGLVTFWRKKEHPSPEDEPLDQDAETDTITKGFRQAAQAAGVEIVEDDAPVAQPAEEPATKRRGGRRSAKDNEPAAMAK